MDHCPTHRELEALMTEQVTGDAAEILRQHLQICPRCQARLDGMSDDLELRRWRRTPGSQGDDDVPNGAAVIGHILKTTLAQTNLALVSDATAPDPQATELSNDDSTVARAEGAGGHVPPEARG